MEVNVMYFVLFVVGYFVGGWLTAGYITDTQQIFYVAEVSTEVDGQPVSRWVIGPPLLPECEWTLRYINLRHRFFTEYPSSTTRRWCRTMLKAGKPGNIYLKWNYKWRA